MYSDLPNLKIISISNDIEVEQYIKKYGLDNNLIKIGFSELNSYIPPYSFDEVFYILCGLDFKNRFELFYVPRDYESEEKVFNELNPENEPYIFIHDDPNRGFKIDRSKISSNLKIIENNLKYSIFEMLKIIENASEVHVMQSSLKDLINSYKIDKPKFFLHNYVRNYGDDCDSKGMNNFVKIN